MKTVRLNGQVQEIPEKISDIPVLFCAVSQEATDIQDNIFLLRKETLDVPNETLDVPNEILDIPNLISDVQNKILHIRDLG